MGILLLLNKLTVTKRNVTCIKSAFFSKLRTFLGKCSELIIALWLGIVKEEWDPLSSLRCRDIKKIQTKKELTFYKRGPR